MNSIVHVFLLALLGALQVAASTSGSAQSLRDLDRIVDRRLLGENVLLVKQIEKEKLKKQKNEKALEQLSQEMETTQHDIKVVTGRRDKPSRLDKLEKENQLKLCWWPENFDQYAYTHLTFGNIGIHFQVPRNMKAFKFNKRPTDNDDHFEKYDKPIEDFVYYFVTRITGQFETPFHLFGPRDILYSGRNPPSELPVKHKDHLFVMVVYAPYNPVKDIKRKLLGADDAIFQLCRCSDMSARVGAPVGLALLEHDDPSGDYGFVFATGGRKFEGLDDSNTYYEYDVYSDRDSESNEDFTWNSKYLVCPLIPLEASRCF